MCIRDRADSPDGTHLYARWTEDDGTAGELDVTVAMPAGHESLSVVIPWSESTFQFTTKDQARPVEGRLVRRGTEVRIGDDGPAWGVLDVGRGRWPYSIDWNWGGGAGLVERVGSVAVPVGNWSYSDPGRLVADRLGATGRPRSFAYACLLYTSPSPRD